MTKEMATPGSRALSGLNCSINWPSSRELMGAAAMKPSSSTESTCARSSGGASSWTMERARVVVMPALTPQATRAA